MKYKDVLAELHRHGSLTSEQLAYSKNITQKHAAIDLLRLYRMGLALRTKAEGGMYHYRLSAQGKRYLIYLAEKFLKRYFLYLYRKGAIYRQNLRYDFSKEFYDFLMEKYWEWQFGRLSVSLYDVYLYPLVFDTS